MQCLIVLKRLAWAASSKPVTLRGMVAYSVCRPQRTWPQLLISLTRTHCIKRTRTHLRAHERERLRTRLRVHGGVSARVPEASPHTDVRVASTWIYDSNTEQGKSW